jgi:hypothetical protein
LSRVWKPAHQFGIELRPGDLEQFQARLVGGQFRPVRPVHGHGRVGVSDGEDAAQQRDVLAEQARRVTGAVVALVMGMHRFEDLGHPW